MINSRYHLVSLAVLALYLLPLFTLGQDTYVLIHDNLDGAIPSFKLLAESGQLFAPSSAIIPNLFGGLPRITLGTEFNVILWLYCLFEPFSAYVINSVLMHLIAFLGMRRLLDQHFLGDECEHYGLISTGVALTFALLPFWPSGGLSVAGLPLALCAFLNIRASKGSWGDWTILLLLPLYSSLVLSFSFFLLGMGVLWLYDLAKGKVNWHFGTAILMMICIFLVVEYRLVMSMFLDLSFVSHRTEFTLAHYGFKPALFEGFHNFLSGQYHAHSLHTYFVFPTVGLALCVSLVKRDKNGFSLFLLFLTGAISLWYGFWGWDGWLPLKEQIGLLRAFNFRRFHFMHPLLWSLLFALALITIKKHFRRSTLLIVAIFVLQAGYLFSHSDFVRGYMSQRISYRSFYAQSLFEEVQRYINRPQNAYRVASLGIHPGIAVFNGFHTIDMYLSNYPLEYKHKFRQIIEVELEQDEKLENYFDNWGSRVYLFSHELGKNFLYTKDRKATVYDFAINTEAFHSLGGEYILSAVEIINHKESHLNFLKKFSKKDSAWDIYLYEVNI